MRRLTRARESSGHLVGFASLLLAVLTLEPAAAATAADQPFYEGKTIKLIVPFSPGGGTDTYARFVARHWGKYIPGKPNILVQNMPGGGGALTFGFVFSKADRNGLTLAVASEGIPVRRLLQLPGHTYELTKMHLIAASPSSTVHYAGKELGVQQLEDLKKASGKIKMGDTQRGSSIATVSGLIFKLLNLDFRQVYGYGSYGETRLALLRGEVNVTGGDAFNYVLVVEPLEKKGDITILFQSGLLDSSGKVARHPMMPHLRTVEEAYRELFGKAPSGKTWDAIKGMIAVNTLGKSIWAPPGVPEGRLSDLEEGFEKMIESPEFQADAVKVLGAETSAFVGKDAEPAVKQFFGLPDEVVQLYR